MAQLPEETRDLVLRARAGSRSAFEELVGACSGLVAAVVAAHTSEPTEIEDLVQETFMTAWRELAKLRKPESFGPWVSAIARNHARTAAAARSRRARIRAEAVDRPSAGSPDSLYRGVLTEVDRLPEGYREVFLLRYVQEQSCAFIAEALGLPLGTVTSRLSRGHEILRERLERKAQ